MCFNTYMPMGAFLWLANCYFGLYLVKLGRAFEINNIQRDHVTCVTGMKLSCRGVLAKDNPFLVMSQAIKTKFGGIIHALPSPSGVKLGPFESTQPLGEQREELIMFVLRNSVTTWIRSATAALGVFAPFLGFADSIPVTPEQISVTPQPILPAFQEVGTAGAMPFVLTVKNISKTHTIGVKASNPISAVIVSQVEIGHVDRSDTLVPPSAFSSTSCIKPNGLPVLLAPGGTCTFTYLLAPVAGPPCPDKNEEPCDSGATTIKFTINPSLGPSVSTEPTFIVEDVPKTAEPASLILFAFGALGLAGSKWFRTRKPVHMLSSFHEKAGECQDFSFIFSLFFSFCFICFFFFQIVPVQPSRLCRHPSIRTLC